MLWDILTLPSDGSRCHLVNLSWGWGVHAQAAGSRGGKRPADHGRQGHSVYLSKHLMAT